MLLLLLCDAVLVLCDAVLVLYDAVSVLCEAVPVLCDAVPVLCKADLSLYDAVPMLSHTVVARGGEQGLGGVPVDAVDVRGVRALLLYIQAI